nr:response regulator [Chloroflexota bacterium]
MGERILVVDDDEQLARIVRDGLTHAGYVVDCAPDGHAALAAARARPPALAVLDLMLP